MATRRERVVLDVESNLAATLLADAVAAKALARELNSLSGQSVQTSRATQNMSRDTDNIAKSANRADSSINQLSGRLRLMAQVSAMLGPALIPIGAVGLPAVAGLANALGVAALAGGSAIIAFQGVGDALEAVNDAALEPTAENIEKARAAMEALSPAAREMVTRLQELRPVLTGIRDTAAEGLFPGMIESLDQIQTRVPEVEHIIGNLSRALGHLASDAGKSLASSEWDEFFAFIATEAPATLTALGQAVGNLTRGLAELWMAFAPLNRDMSSWMVDISRGFDSWASGLAQTEGFRDFIDYVRTSGPQVADTFGALANAVVQVVQASAPLGGPVLKALEAVANVIATIANSDIGVPLFATIAAFSAVSRGMAIVNATSGALNAALEKTGRGLLDVEGSSSKAANALRTLGTATAVVGGVLALDAAIDALLESTRDAAPGVQELAGRLLDLQSGAADNIGAQFKGLAENLDFFVKNEPSSAWVEWIPNITGLLPGENAEQKFQRLREEFEALDAALANIAASGSAEQATAALEALFKAEGLSATQQKELIKLLPQYQEALAGSANASKLDTSATEANTAAHRKNAATLSAEREQRLRNQNAVINYQASIDDATQALRDNGRTLDITTEKGRANRTALLNLVSAWNDQSKAVRSNKQEQQAAIGTFVRVATQMGMNEEAARRYAERLFDIPPKRETRILLGGIEASMADLAALQARINSLHGKTIYNTVRTIGGPQPGPMADGGTVPGQRFPYGDKTLILAAPGEEVITNRNGEADRFRADRAAGRIPHYADGGTVAARHMRYTVPASPPGGSFVAAGSGFSDALAQTNARLDRISNEVRALGDERGGIAIRPASAALIGAATGAAVGDEINNTVKRGGVKK